MREFINSKMIEIKKQTFMKFISTDILTVLYFHRGNHFKGRKKKKGRKEWIKRWKSKRRETEI